MPVFVRASSRAKAYVRGGNSSAGKHRRLDKGRQDLRGANGATQNDAYFKSKLAQPRISRARRKKVAGYLRTFRHGY